ncbi:MAG: hypothetical protein AAAFM81_11420 [Pseudomonadota bacterium]
MQITDHYQLLALHRCLLEAKFSPNPWDPDIAGSPIAAVLANTVVAELAQQDSQDWDDWRKIEHHGPMIERLIKGLEKADLTHWRTTNDRATFVTNALAPLVATPEQTQILVARIFGDQSFDSQ